MRELAGGVAVVTGAASGIGRAVAEALAAEKMSLAICDVDAGGLEKAAEKGRATGAKVTTHVVDVGDAKRMAEFAEEVIAEHGRVTLLVNNAGVGLVGTLEELSLDDMEWLMRINFWGVVHGTKIFLPILRREKAAHIVNLSSVFGIIAPPGQTAYSASKFAIRGFSEALRHELQGSGIGISCVYPGGIRTRIGAKARLGAGMTRDRDAFIAEWERLARNSPEYAARKIVEGVKKNKPRILIGADAYTIAAIQWLRPVEYWKLMGRTTKPGISESPSYRRTVSESQDK